MDTPQATWASLTGAETPHGAVVRRPRLAVELPPIGTRSLIDRFEPFERFERHTGFKLRAVLFPLCRHRPAPPRPLLWTQHAILITCPVFGVHYTMPSMGPGTRRH